MASKLPRLSSLGGTAKTDDEKLHLFQKDRSKPITVNSVIAKKIEGSLKNKEINQAHNVPKLMTNKSAHFSGMTLKPKSKSEKAKNIKFNVHNKENIDKGVTEKPKVKENSSRRVRENDKKELLPKVEKKENIKKTGVIKINTVPNKLNKCQGFAGLSLIPKLHQSHKSTLELSKSMRRSKTESDLQTGKPLESEKYKLNETRTIPENEAITQDLKLQDVVLPDNSETMQELAQELLNSKKADCHGGLKFLPKLKKKTAAFNFNVNTKPSK